MVGAGGGGGVAGGAGGGGGGVAGHHTLAGPLLPGSAQEPPEHERRLGVGVGLPPLEHERCYTSADQLPLLGASLGHPPAGSGWSLIDEGGAKVVS